MNREDAGKALRSSRSASAKIETPSRSGGVMMRRVLPAELNTIYIKNYSTTEQSQSISTESNEFLKQLNKSTNNSEPIKMNETKGGFRITEYLNYNW